MAFINVTSLSKDSAKNKALSSSSSSSSSMAFIDVADSIEPDMKSLTIKIPATSRENSEKSLPISPTISISPHLNSPSPPSSAFVSALQSPYISPRVLEPPQAPSEHTSTTTSHTATTSTTPTTTTTLPSPISCSCSHSDDIPSTSYTPPSESCDLSVELIDQKPKLSDVSGPRISFSFPVPRLSFNKPPVSPFSDAMLSTCDVYIGYHGQNPNLIRFCKWLKSELELQGIASFAADRAKYSYDKRQEVSDRVIYSASFGIVVVTSSSLVNPLSAEEIRFFAQKRNLVPLLFDLEVGELARLMDGRMEDKDCREAFELLLSKFNEFKLEANDSNLRSCVSRIVGILSTKLGRKSMAKESDGIEELPFPMNKLFVGREKELMEIEAAFFGCGDAHELENSKTVATNRRSNSDGFVDEESHTVKTSDRFISLEIRSCKEPTLEAWIDPVNELANKGRSFQKQRSKKKKSRNGGSGNASVLCINGTSGIGKTEIALEFAYRYSQRYKMVLWVAGEVRYLRQNLLNLSMSLGLDVSAETEKERGRMKSIEEQELEAFERIKRELFRDVPYLVIIDNLETEREWWEGKDLHNFIPRNTGATHVIVTTRLPKVMNVEPMQLQPLPLADALLLMKVKYQNEYTEEELQVLRKFGERLGRSSFGLSVIGSLLSELVINPSELFEAIEQMSISDSCVSFGVNDDGFFTANAFLTKVLVFCFAILDQAAVRRKCLALRMALAGAWLAPAPVSSTLLAAAAYKISSKDGNCSQWKKCMNMAFSCCSNCCSSPGTRKNEAESALLLVKLDLAKRTTRQPGCWIQFHPITQQFTRMQGGSLPAKATVLAVKKNGNAVSNSDHLWASVHLVFGFKSEPPLVQLKAEDMVLFIKNVALPLAIRSFVTFSRCNSALELLKVCTDVLEDVEKSFVSQTQDWNHGSLCWKKKKREKLHANQRVDEYVWQDVTLLKATLLETRAKLMLRGGHFNSVEKLCRTCISIRTVMLGPNHAQTFAAQETLAKLVRLRSKI